MRLLILSCLSFLLQGSGKAYSLPALLQPTSNVSFLEFGQNHADELSSPLSAALTLTLDSIHHVNCLRATGYLEVVANGGVEPYTYLWNNGNTGVLGNSLLPGTYEITVTDDDGTTATFSATILEDLVVPEADAGEDFTAACANSILTLNGSGSIGANFAYGWSASNGGIIQSGGNTLHPVISHTGSFSLVVSNTSNGCTSTAGLVVSATNQPPIVTATGGTFTCSQPKVTLNATFPVPNTTFVWNGPNGFVSYLLNPQVNVVGTFVFKVTDSVTTCINTANAVVLADTTKPVALPIGGELNCMQQTLPITGTFGPPGVTFLWSGPFGYTSTLQNPVVFVAGIYRVTVTNPTNGCTKTNSTTVTANFTLPTALATAGGTLTCTTNSVQLNGSGSPAGITFSWVGPNNFSSSQQNPSVSFAGIYTLTTRNPQNGCTATATTTVFLDNSPPGATATGGVKTCTNQTVTLQASSPTQGATYKWSGPSGFMSTLQNPVVSLTGTYTVTATGPVNGCISTASVNVTQNITPPSVTATTAHINCYTPTPNILATSQTNGATFAWSGPNGFSSNIASPTVAVSGTYTVTATNPVNGCTATKSIFVDENLTTPFVYAGEDRALNCNFTSILSNPIGTTTGNTVTYLWTTWDGHIFSGATSLYARFDAIGHYTLAVKNIQSGCVVKDSMEVTQTPILTLSTVQLNSVSCNGGSNGSIKVTPDGGSSPYSYIWTNGSQTATVNNLSVGTYTVTTTDSEGCTAVSSVAVTQPGVLQANISATGQTQVGLNNGTASVTPTGGTTPYTVHWSNGGTSLTIANLAPGSYTVTVTDNRGCTQSNTANVNAVNCSISGEISATNLNCAGVPTGTATVNVGGVPNPITYLWSNGAQTKTASNLAAGNYSVTVTGGNGCSTVLSTQITGPQPLLLSVVSNTGVTCAGLQNGTVTLNTTGGTAPYTYVWSNGTTGATASALAVGTYSCTTTDAHGCTLVQSAQIAGPQVVSLTVLAKTDVACFDGQNGSMTMNATGGTAPFNYLWSNNASGPTIQNLSIGTYSCTVTDANGCSKNLSDQIVATDNTPPQLILKNASIALNASGAATVTPSMFDNGSFDQNCGIVNWLVTPSTFGCGQLGTSMVTLSATDRNGNLATGTALVSVIDNIAPELTCPADQTASACASTVFFNAPSIQDNCTPTVAATLISGLPSGASFPVGVTMQQYSYTDAGGNTATCQFSVTVSSSSNVAIDVLSTNCSGNCAGSATLSVLSGGNPVSVVWSDGQTGLNAVNLCAGTYFATLTDGSGCSQTYVAQIQVQDAEVPVLTCPSNLVAGYCNPVVTYTLPLVTDNCTVNMQQLQQVSGLPSGATFPIGLTTQLFRYTDGGGNIGECSFNVTVHLAASVNASATNITCYDQCNGTASITVSGGQAPFGILWSNGAAGPFIGNLCQGIYTATVTDGDGCQQTVMAQITQPTPMVMGSSNITNDMGNSGIGSIAISMTGGSLPYSYSWTLDGQYFSPSQNVFGLFAGDYVLVVTDARGCTFTSATFTISNLVATTTPEDAFEWLLFPNPAQSEVFLKMDALEGVDSRLSIYDASGRLLLEEDMLSANQAIVRIDLSSFPDGMLMVRVANELGNFSKMLLKREH